MGDVISKAKHFIDYSGGNFQLKRVNTCDVSFEGDLEVIKALGVSGGAGFKETEGGGSLQLEIFAETGVPEVDYNRLWRSKEQFRYVIQEEGGKRFQYRFCRVAQPTGRKYSTDGSVMHTVKIMFLQHGDL